MTAGMSKRRNYSDAFLTHSFVNLTDKDQDRLRCFIFNKVLTKESLKLPELDAHLKKHHLALQGQDRAFFELKAKPLKRIQFGAQRRSEQQLLAGVEPAHIVAHKAEKQQKCHTIAEKLIMPLCKSKGGKCAWQRSSEKTEHCFLCQTIGFAGRWMIWLKIYLRR